MLAITFGFDINRNLKVGDNVYYINEAGGTVLLGPAVSIVDRTLTVDVDPSTVRPDVGQFILFVPNRSVESSGLIGFEGTCVMVNDSTKKAELFAVSSEVFISS